MRKSPKCTKLPLTSSAPLQPPDVPNIMIFSQAFPVFRCSSSSMFIVNANQRTKNGVGLGTRLYEDHVTVHTVPPALSCFGVGATATDLMVYQFTSLYAPHSRKYLQHKLLGYAGVQVSNVSVQHTKYANTCSTQSIYY